MTRQLAAVVIAALVALSTVGAIGVSATSYGPSADPLSSGAASPASDERADVTTTADADTPATPTDRSAPSTDPEASDRRGSATPDRSDSDAQPRSEPSDPDSNASDGSTDGDTPTSEEPTINSDTEFDRHAKVTRRNYPGSVGEPNQLKPLDWASADGHDHSGGEAGGHDHGAEANSHNNTSDGSDNGSRNFQALSTTPGTCSTGEATKRYDVVAMNVDIPLNRFGDHDPQGRMFTLESNVPAVRNQESTSPSNPDRVSIGLRDDPIQPLVIRANLGDCVTVTLENRLNGEDASFHVHRGPVTAEQAGTNVGENPSTLVAPGGERTYTFRIPKDDRYEGVWYFHSHGNTREQTSHGLFGALVIEHAGSKYYDPENPNKELRSGWEAIIVDGEGNPDAYREYVTIYHEIGNDDYRPLNKNGENLPLVDPLTNTYRPCTKALNYRSECFLNRMQLLNSTDNIPKGSDFDKGLAYSSYAFGDPATPIPRAYVGDPSKVHIVHGGSEQFHSHHLHGGGIRWRFDPHTDSHAGHALMQRASDGAVKRPPANDVNSESPRVDSQTIGPGETFSQEIACGAGGCQRSVGDFLFHCHIPDHYFAGMWSMWRVYNTEQADLAELPGREGEVKEAVTSVELIGENLPSGETLTEENVDDWVESNLPPQGVRDGYDATVYDWKKEETDDGPLYLTEPLDTHSWANYEPDAPGERKPMMFDPVTGRPAYPMLTPHLGARPPFAPGVHGPAPYLSTSPTNASDVVQNNDRKTVAPDPNRPDDAICPAGSSIKRFNVVAVETDAKLNDDGDVMNDANLYVLADEKEAVLNGEKPAQPLIYRANVGDCVMLTLTSELPDERSNHFWSSVNIHPHFVQFDIQASGGVDTGYGYERTIRPYRTEGRTLTTSVSEGDTVLPVTNTDGLHEGIWIGVGLGTDDVEFQRIAEIDESAKTITLEEPLVRDHGREQAVGVEFVRYAYYIDANLGSVYFHDHVDALNTWPKGLFGTLVVEPEGSTYHDPTTGERLRSGPVADIHTDRPVVASDGAKSFRELVLMFSTNRFDSQDVGDVTGTVNLRAESLGNRMRNDPAYALSSAAYGDPSTPLLRAYEGDPVMIRTVNSATVGRFPFRLTGHEFLNEHTAGASARDSVIVDISERQDLWVKGGAGEAGDYLWYVAQADHFESGMWGLMRVHDTRQSDLQPLPGRGTSSARAGNSCPADAPVRQFDVVAMDVDVDGPEGNIEKAFVLAEDAEAVERGEKEVEPLVLRAAAGDCVVVNLRNDLGERVSMHLGRLSVDPKESLGITVGNNPDQSVAPGETRTYRGHVASAFGSAIVADFAQLDKQLEGQRDGLYGALVAAPKGARFFDPQTGEEVTTGSDVVVVAGDETYRDPVLIFHGEEPRIGTPVMPYRTEVDGKTLVNYRTEPLEDTNRDGDPSTAFSSRAHGDPATPLLRAYPGDDMRVHVLQGYGLQEGIFSLNGHGWQRHPNVERSTVVDTAPIAPHTTVDAHLTHGASAPGDYLWLNHRLPYAEAGQWGLFRVHGELQDDLLTLDEVAEIARSTPPADFSNGTDGGNATGDAETPGNGEQDTKDGSETSSGPGGPEENQEKDAEESEEGAATDPADEGDGERNDGRGEDNESDANDGENGEGENAADEGRLSAADERSSADEQDREDDPRDRGNRDRDRDDRNDDDRQARTNGTRFPTLHR